MNPDYAPASMLRKWADVADRDAAETQEQINRFYQSVGKAVIQKQEYEDSARQYRTAADFLDANERTEAPS